jgi:cytochrome P450
MNFDPYDMDFANNPYPVYKYLRDESPVFYNEALNFWAISRYADVVEAHRDSETFSSAGGVSIEGIEAGGSNLITKDLPEHRWHKMLVTKVFTRERMNGMEDFVRGLCVKLLEQAGQREEFDFVKDFAVRLPLDVISELIGIPEAYRNDIHHFANMALLRAGDVDPRDQWEAKRASDRTYLELVRERRANPRDDVITMLMETEVEDDQGVARRLTDKELAARFMELAIAGHETVAKTLPNGAMALERFPSERAKLLHDRALTPAAVEEILRFDPPSQLQGRTTTRDVELHGKTIPSGARTMLLTGAATRDERRFDDPDVFNVTRENDMTAIYFGYGIHRCLGIHLARLEIRVAFEELLARYPDFHVYPDRATRKVLSNVRGVDTLPCRPGAHA